jgi:diguanylate cyclase (GGDEF)-like protein
MRKAGRSMSLSGLEVLVAEDESTSARIIVRALSKYGARVEVALSGRAALMKFSERHFPLVITDINMPGMNGLELASRIKALDQNTLIIATTIVDDPHYLIKALELGFSDYILKPYSIKKLLLAVERCIEVIAVKRELENERNRFKTVLESLSDGITIKDLDFRVLYQNKSMIKIFGHRLGTACYESFGLNGPCEDCPTVLALQDGMSHSACRVFQRNETTFTIETSASLLRDADGEVSGVVEIIRDVSERTKNEEIIREMAFHDPLTGLANRRLFEDRLEQTIAKAQRHGTKFGLLCLDLDNFKTINDSMGHEAGDMVLVETGERIRSCCKRDLDTISRQGGDEFSIIIDDFGTREQLAAIAEKLINCLSHPIDLSDSTVQVTISIGISVYPANGTNLKELEIAADQAMYAAKKAGRNTFCFWELQ